jgi:hypothetical protein
MLALRRRQLMEDCIASNIDQPPLNVLHALDHHVEFPLCETAGSKHNVFPQNTGLEYSCIIRMTKAEMTYNFSMFPIAKLYVREHG